MATGFKVAGLKELDKKLHELSDPKDQARVLRAAGRVAMNKTVLQKARANIAAISPGKAQLHKTYKGRLVSAGFASRSLTTRVMLSRDKTTMYASLGVKKEAFYALQFFELGTALIPKKPWLVPAMESSQSQLVAQFAETMRERIMRIARKKGGK